MCSKASGDQEINWTYIVQKDGINVMDIKKTIYNKHFHTL